MSDYRADLPGMQALIDGATRLEQSIDERVDAVARTVAALHVDWAGDAADAHQAASVAWAAGAGEMEDALAQLRTALDTARTAYRSVGVLNHGMWP